jgi:uncharacterized protein YndB with AHSA1/START domain
MAQTLSGMKKPRASHTPTANELSITRVFKAPGPLVWKAWTEPAIVRRWWGPKGYTCPVANIDLRVGGKYLNDMRSPEGKDYWSTGTYREIQPMERIVATDSFADAKGNVVPASYYGMTGEFPLELLVTVTFKEQKGKTTMTLRHEGMPPGEMTESAKAGWNESFDKLAAILDEEKNVGKTVLVAEPGKQEASMIRVFDAPRDRVYHALTDPKLMVQWWAPQRFTTIIDTLDVRPGGFWRILNRDRDGNEFWFHGVYHEVSHKRIVNTFEFEGMPEHVLLGVMTLEDIGNKTKLTSKSIFESVEDRDGMLKSGMEDGGPETFDLLAKLVEKTD